MGEVPGYDYDADRDRRWQRIVDSYCVLEGTNEADDVAPRLLEAGARRLVEVGSHWGPVAERVSRAGALAFCVELDPDVVRLAHRPAVRATAEYLPFADGSVDAVTALNVLYFLERPGAAVAEAYRVLRPGGWFVACTQARDNDPEFRDVVPWWGEVNAFDGDNAEAVVRSVFDDVEVEPWDLVAYRLPDRDAVAEYLAVFFRLPEEEARQRAEGFETPLGVTKRGLYVRARKPRAGR